MEDAKLQKSLKPNGGIFNLDPEGCLHEESNVEKLGRGQCVDLSLCKIFALMCGGSFASPRSAADKASRTEQLRLRQISHGDDM
ncbi:hypothetical protein NPIL_565271 [Nephila pilipes]|uniref:Uncharacterized protein n=1 Tax=Nephila pilipes TaxID=299642 RepID=A0A8X6QBI8_NEPPI|nr:hypothetical protein NPIL_565271 [Nephila pilipes]